jgi:hypothetical protein
MHPSRQRGGDGGFSGMSGSRSMCARRACVYAADHEGDGGGSSGGGSGCRSGSGSLSAWARLFPAACSADTIPATHS